MIGITVRIDIIRQSADEFRIEGALGGARTTIAVAPTLPEATRTREAIVTFNNLELTDGGSRHATIGITLTKGQP